MIFTGNIYVQFKGIDVKEVKEILGFVCSKVIDIIKHRDLNIIIFFFCFLFSVFY